jgi:chromosomal replication initiation ATPase DnaA
MNLLKRLFKLLFYSSAETVVMAVENTTGFSREELRSSMRGKKVAAARQVLIKQLQAHTELSVVEIAQEVNRSTQYVYYVLNS